MKLTCTGTTERSVKIRGTEAQLIGTWLGNSFIFEKGEKKSKGVVSSAEQRMKKQLEEFWTTRNSTNVKLCSVNEVQFSAECYSKSQEL